LNCLLLIAGLAIA